MQNSDMTLPDFAKGSKRLLIGGQWRPAASGKQFDTLNPATGDTIASLAQGEAADVDLAVQAARRAFEGEWSRWTPYDRQRLLLRIHDLIEKHFDELASIETVDMGAPLSRTRGMKDFASQLILFASQTAVGGVETPRNSLPGQIMILTHRAPVGVVGGIIAWNAPLMSQWWIIGPTLATGCTAVLKPAEDASLSTLRVAELLLEAGVPEGRKTTHVGNDPGDGFSRQTMS
jgi:aldehyde dehydrogenase (NAD+)